MKWAKKGTACDQGSRNHANLINFKKNQKEKKKITEKIFWAHRIEEEEEDFSSS